MTPPLLRSKRKLGTFDKFLAPRSEVAEYLKYSVGWNHSNSRDNASKS